VWLWWPLLAVPALFILRSCIVLRSSHGTSTASQLQWASHLSMAVGFWLLVGTTIVPLCTR
jgi:hypothetical protein